MTSRRLLAIALVGLTYCLIVLGGWVRSTNSGLSCPDWPTCYGYWILTPSDFAALGNVGYTYGQVMLEWSHRLMAGFVVGPLILALAVIAFIRRKIDHYGWYLAFVILVVLLVQASLGGVTVLDRNSPWSVALHLGTALVLLSLLILVVVRDFEIVDEATSINFRLLSVALWVVAICVMTSAAVTSKSGASLACYEWPGCTESIFPDLRDPLVFVHALHRTLAALLGIGIIALWVLSHRAGQFRVRRLAMMAVILVLCQIGLGALVIVLEVPVWSAVAHQALGILIFSIVTTILWLVIRSPLPSIEGSHHVRLRSA